MLQVKLDAINFMNDPRPSEFLVGCSGKLTGGEEELWFMATTGVDFSLVSVPYGVCRAAVASPGFCGCDCPLYYGRLGPGMKAHHVNTAAL